MPSEDGFDVVKICIVMPNNIGMREEGYVPSLLYRSARQEHIVSKSADDFTDHSNSFCVQQPFLLQLFRESFVRKHGVLLWVEDTEFAKQLVYCIIYFTV